MNFIKTLAAAAALAVISAPAFAGIKGVSDGTSEVFLVVGDSNGSFLLDTGISLNALMAAAQNGTTGTLFSGAVASAAWTSYLASDTNIFDGSSNGGTRWSLFVYDGITNFDPTGHKIITTVGTGVTPSSINFNADSLISSYSFNAGIAQQANSTGTHPTEANGTSFNSKGTTGYFGNEFFTFSGGNTKIGNAVGTDSRLVFINPVDPDDTFVNVSASYLGSLSARFDGQSLTIAAAVPEPGTYALMLGGLAAVGFVARRRRAV